MKIAFINHIKFDYSIETVYEKPLGGTQSTICYLAEKLAQAGQEVFLFNNISKSQESKNVTCFPLNQVPKSLLDVIELVIIVNTSDYGTYWRAKFRKQVPLILWIHHDYNQPQIESLHSLEQQNRYDQFVFVSEWQKNRFIREFALPPEKTIVLRNAVSPYFENLFAEDESIVSSKSKPLTLAYTSTPFRGLDILLDLFPSMRQRIPKLRLKVFSSMKVYFCDEQKDHELYGWLYEKCQNTEGVDYIGSVSQSQLAQELKSVAMFAYPNTFEETSCIAILEAMASGCLIVTSDLGALGETSAGFAQLVSVEDFGDNYRQNFLNQVCNLLKMFEQENRAELETQLRQQINFVQKNYTWSIRSLEWLDYLQKIEQERSSFYLGINHFLQENFDQAREIWFELLLEAENPEETIDTLLNFLDQEGIELIKQGNYYLAFHLYSEIENIICEQELELKPEYGIYFYHFGLVLSKKGLDATQNPLFKDLEEAYQRAIALNPHLPEAYNNLGNIYFVNKLFDQAEAIYRQQIEYNPDYFGGYFNLTGMLNTNGSTKAAIEIAQQALQKFPDDLLWQIKQDLTLPFIYQNQTEIEQYRERFTRNLEQLVQKFKTGKIAQGETAVRAIANHTNFQLAYQAFNHLELQKKYGQLVEEIVTINYPQFTSLDKSIKSDNLGNKKIKIGYISGCLHNHVVAKLSLGWFKHHNRELFELYTYHIGSHYDELTQKLENYSDNFVHCPQNWQAIIEQILQDDLDILVFLDIGMLPQMTLLASLRLAPVQCTTWFHPETSGLSNVDYFLSSDLMEPENAQDHYSETLIRLPNLAISYQKPQIPPLTKTRADFGIPGDRVIYFCGQSLFKYLPQHDYILATIAQRLSEAQFIFIARPNQDIASLFKTRLTQAFEALNLDIGQYCLFLSSLNRDDYLNLNQLSDVFLDTFAWSGGNTTLEAIACNLPVVTCPGEFMRGRHSYAILKMLGVTETIAQNEEEYIDIAVKLGTNSQWRTSIVEKIKHNHSNLYDDLECVRGLEDFFTKTVKLYSR